MWTRIEVVAALAASAGIALALVGSPVGAPTQGHRGEPTVAVSFAEDILPIFQNSCIKCHGETDENGFEIAEAGLYLTTYKGVMMGSEFGSVVDPEDEQSLLLAMVADGSMPEEGDPLTADQIELIRTWILEGAKETAGS